MAWIRACEPDRIGDGAMLGIEHGGRRILLARFAGALRAMDGTCTHAEADLSCGFLSEEGVRCPLHLSVFGADGAPLNPPAQEPLRVMPVKEEPDGIYVEV